MLKKQPNLQKRLYIINTKIMYPDNRALSIKDAAEVMGMSESAFRDTFGDLISDTPRKPTMKAV